MIATSSCEAELYAASKTAMEALGVQAYLTDLGQHAEVMLHLDSSATLCLTHRKGLRKAKNIEVQHLWLQEAVKNHRLRCQKISTDHNPADMLTKILPESKVIHLMNVLRYVFLDIA